MEKQNKAKMSGAKSVAKAKRSPFPRSPKPHKKHAMIQGDPNTIGRTR